MKRNGALSEGTLVASTWLSRGEALSEGVFKNTGVSVCGFYIPMLYSV